jgi:glycosyltransferase involved in cell wall biosynthesis
MRCNKWAAQPEHASSELLPPMRIVIDLQGAQTSGSMHRGIGRYTIALTRAILRQGKEHEVILVLNGRFALSLQPVRDTFAGLLPSENIRVWEAPGPTEEVSGSNSWRSRSAEFLREAFIESLKPDWVLVSSLFEGLGDDAVASVGRLSNSVPTAVILYDIIPYLFRKTYLPNPQVESWYERKLQHLRRADLLLSISHATRSDAIAHLDVCPSVCVAISTAADERFAPMALSVQEEREVRGRYGLSRPFVMYTGGIDYRKNLDRLITAYSRLPKAVRATHQLAIVCSILPEQREHFLNFARELGLAEDELALTGYVSEEDLVALYNLCHLFVFPSWHEGFGLPVLEAMRCGRPVIGSNRSSIPEVIGCEEALFDPYDEAAITAKLQHALENPSFLQKLAEHGIRQAEQFNWDHCADRALRAMEQRLASVSRPKARAPSSRLRMAYVSPLPPARSGIADYSVELLPELAKVYDIDVVVVQEVTEPWVVANCPIRSVEDFLRQANSYDRVIYHFGNSGHHAHMLDLLREVPGVVSLHDFYLSGLMNYRAHLKWLEGIGGTFEQELYRSHGYAAVADFLQHQDVSVTADRFPMNLEVVRQALGVVVHSKHAASLGEQWHGAGGGEWAVVPLARASRSLEDRREARRALGIEDDAIVVGSFGIIAPSKCHLELIESWTQTRLARNPKARLILIGESPLPAYQEACGKWIERESLGERVLITGWTDAETFRRYLSAVDIAVQLRAHSRGETSAAVLDCLGAGLATVVNSVGSMAELPQETVLMLPEKFSSTELAQAIDRLAEDEPMRRQLGEAARSLVRSRHSPKACGAAYVAAIEEAYDQPKRRLLEAYRKMTLTPERPEEWASLAQAVVRAFPPSGLPQALVDITALVSGEVDDRIGNYEARIGLRAMLETPVADWRIEPVYFCPRTEAFRYARRYCFDLLKVSGPALQDEVIDWKRGDALISSLPLEPGSSVERMANLMERFGVAWKQPSRIAKTGIPISAELANLLWPGAVDCVKAPASS